MFRLRQRHFEGGAWRQGHFTFRWGWQHLHVLQIFIVLQSHAKKNKKQKKKHIISRLFFCVYDMEQLLMLPQTPQHRKNSITKLFFFVNQFDKVKLEKSKLECLENN